MYTTSNFSYINEHIGRHFINRKPSSFVEYKSPKKTNDLSLDLHKVSNPD